MSKTILRRHLCVAALSSLMLAACAGAPKAPPKYDSASTPEAQAATFIGTNKDVKRMPSVNKVAVLSCNVMFAHAASAHAGTGSGILGDAGNYTRAEAKVSVFYTLVGLSDADYQRMTDQICANAEQRLAGSGFDLVPRATLMANEKYQALQAAGRETPFEYKAPGAGKSSRYMVYTVTGGSLYDPRYIGSMSGIGQAFKAAKGTSADQIATALMDQLGATGVNINLLVDFAELQSSGHGRGIQLADTNTAEVGGEVGLSVSGDIAFRVNEGLKCWDRFGNRECMVENGYTPTLASTNPVLMNEQFYRQVSDTTTTGDKAVAVLTKGLAVLSAMGGVKGSSQSTTRYEVEVEPGQFGDVASRGAQSFIDMALITAKSHR